MTHYMNLWDDMLLYYTREDIEKYGVVGLELAKNI